MSNKKKNVFITRKEKQSKAKKIRDGDIPYHTL